MYDYYKSRKAETNGREEEVNEQPLEEGEQDEQL